MDALDKYGELVTLVSHYMAARRKANRRASNPLNMLRNLAMSGDNRQMVERPYAERTARQQEFINRIYEGQNTESPAVRAAMSRTPSLELAQHYRDAVQPTPQELDQIKVLNDHAGKVTQQNTPRAYVFSVITVGTLVAKLVPKEVFEYFGWKTYGLYQTIVTLATIGIAAYLAMILIPIWQMYRRRNAAIEVCDNVLAHAKVLKSST